MMIVLKRLKKKKKKKKKKIYFCNFPVLMLSNESVSVLFTRGRGGKKKVKKSMTYPSFDLVSRLLLGNGRFNNRFQGIIISSLI